MLELHAVAAASNQQEAPNQFPTAEAQITLASSRTSAPRDKKSGKVYGTAGVRITLIQLASVCVWKKALLHVDDDEIIPYQRAQKHSEKHLHFLLHTRGSTIRVYVRLGVAQNYSNYGNGYHKSGRE